MAPENLHGKEKGWSRNLKEQNLDAARTSIWGDGTGGTQLYSDPNPPNNSNVTVTIYGRIPASQDVSAGTYTNTVTATINF